MIIVYEEEMEKYKQAIDEFNVVKSFNIMYPENDSLYEKLAKYTNAVNINKTYLSNYEVARKLGDVNESISTDICKFVVHINQLTNEIKEFPRKDPYLYM